MNIMNWIQFPLYIGVLLILVKPLGDIWPEYIKVKGLSSLRLLLQ